MFSDSNYDSEITISDIWTNIEDGIVFPIGKFFFYSIFSPFKIVYSKILWNRGSSELIIGLIL